MTAHEINEWKEIIDSMNHYEMARTYRFAPVGHPIFTSQLLTLYFMKRFNDFGGMTTKVSKVIGW